MTIPERIKSLIWPFKEEPIVIDPRDPIIVSGLMFDRLVTIRVKPISRVDIVLKVSETNVSVLKSRFTRPRLSSVFEITNAEHVIISAIGSDRHFGHMSDGHVYLYLKRASRFFSDIWSV